MSESLEEEAIIRYSWTLVGTMHGAPYSFLPASTQGQLYKAPAIYLWGFFAKDRLVKVYVGETENLKSRLCGYMKPGPTQETNKRIKEQIEQGISSGLEVRLETLQIVPVSLNRVHLCNENLCDPFLRKMMENFILADLDVVYVKVLNITLEKLNRRKRRANKNNPFIETLRANGLNI